MITLSTGKHIWVGEKLLDVLDWENRETLPTALEIQEALKTAKVWVFGDWDIVGHFLSINRYNLNTVTLRDVLAQHDGTHLDEPVIPAILCVLDDQLTLMFRENRFAEELAELCGNEGIKKAWETGDLFRRLFKAAVAACADNIDHLVDLVKLPDVVQVLQDNTGVSYWSYNGANRVRTMRGVMAVLRHIIDQIPDSRTAFAIQDQIADNAVYASGTVVTERLRPDFHVTYVEYNGRKWGFVSILVKTDNVTTWGDSVHRVYIPLWDGVRNGQIYYSWEAVHEAMFNEIVSVAEQEYQEQNNVR